jgi:hypothetical protein
MCIPIHSIGDLKDLVLIKHFLTHTYNSLKEISRTNLITSRGQRKFIFFSY